MQFSVGDKVVHPQYGPGRIIDAEHRELVEGFEHYFVIELLIDESTLYIPMRMMDELGVRPVMSKARLTRVLETLRSVPRQLSKDFKKRQGRIRTKLATARPVKVAEAVRDLTFRRKQKHLTKVDKRLLNRGRELLAAEMAVATDTQVLDAHETISTALKGTTPGESDEAERVPTAPVSETLVHKLLKRVKRDQKV